jgi:glycosyltransferase involved in cell wall biosynthesis
VTRKVFAPGVTFLLVGGRGRLLDDLHLHYSHLPNVRCVGQKSAGEARLLQCASDFLLYPLTRSSPWWRYTSPLKLFEYMAAGRTIIASNIGSAGEIVDETTAYVFNGDDEDDMVAAFGRALAASEGEREAKRRRARQLVCERYDWRKRVAFVLKRWSPGSCVGRGRWESSSPRVDHDRYGPIGAK